MNLIWKYLVFTFFGYWMAYIAINFLFRTITGKNLELQEITLIGLGWATLFTVALGGGFYFSIVPRIRYIVSDDIKAPAFGDKQERTISLKNDDISFEELQEKIARKWVLTHVDNEPKVIKFKTKDAFFNWGTGTYIKFDATVNTVSITSFPFIGYTQRGRRLKTEINDLVEAMIMNS